MRVIFDRSAFHREHGEILLASPLLEVCRRGVITVFHTPFFLDETLATYRAGQGGTEWRRHLSFALDVCNGGIFLDRGDIFHDELVVGRGPFARHLMPERPSRRYDSRPRMMERLREVARTGDLAQAWKETEEERKEAKTKKQNQRRISKEIRDTIVKHFREGTVVGSARDYPFEKFRAATFTRTGRLLMDQVSKIHAPRLADQWAHNPARFPFYSAFVEGFSYTGYYAAVEINAPLDENAQPDYEQLAYLTWADLVVTNEKGFFRKAFETLWKPRSKRIENTDSFVSLVRRLA